MNKLHHFSESDIKGMEIIRISETPLEIFEEASNQTIDNFLDKKKIAEAKYSELYPQYIEKYVFLL